MRDKFDHLFIDGEYVRPEKGTVIHSISPATGKPWGDVAIASAVDINRAVEAAKRAFEGWRSAAPSERGRAIYRLGELIDQHAEELAAIDSRDNGKPFTQSLGDARSAANWLRYYGGASDKLEGGHFRLSDDEWVLTIGEPLGVIGAITPWNFPIMAASFKIGAALATGNTLVMKPSEIAGASTLALGELVQEAGIPAGVVNIVPGYGADAGQALVEHPDVAKISFTGSERTAQHVGALAMAEFKKITIEAGGKAPFVVFDDVDLDKTVEAAIGGMFVNAGQQCTVASRVLVHESVFQEFVDRYVARAKLLRVGEPSDPQTEVGAIASEVQRDKILGYIESARSDGATILLGGGKVDAGAGHEDGFFIEPTVIVDVQPDWKIVQEEIFGPVVVIMPFRDEAEAVELANSTKYGLVSAVWTRDLGRAQRVARQIKAGVVWVNTYRKLHPNVPYGGAKRSGYGRENGMAALRAYTEVKSIIIDGRA